MEILTRDECKKIIYKLSRELCVPPGLILERLMSEKDKADMLAGEISIESLRCHIGAWKANGMEDLVGSSAKQTWTIPDNKKLKYNKPFISYAEVTCVKDDDSN
jgi:hypothetical protein